MNAMSGQPPKAALLDAPLTDVFRPHFSRLRRVWVLSLIASLLALAPSVYMLEVYDRVVNSRSHMTLWMLSLAAVILLAAMEILEWLRSEMLHEVGRTADLKMAPRLFNLVFEAHLRRLPGGTLQVFSDWRLIRDFLHSPFVLSLMELPTSIVFLVLIYLISPLLAWVTLVAAVVQVALAWLTSRITQPPLALANRSASQAQTYADGSLRNAEVIEAMGMLRSIHMRWVRRQSQFLRLQAQASMMAGGLQSISKMVQLIIGSTLLGLSAWLMLKNQLNGGPAMMIVSSIIGGRVLAPMVQMMAQWQLALNARESWQRLNGFLAMLPEREAAMELPAPRGVLTAEQLIAGAPPMPGQQMQPILRGIQFAARPGEMLAVIGPSASGKTTLARVLVGLWPSVGGKVRLDGADVYAWDKSELGPHIGYLPQGVELFEGTVGENIARFGEIDRKKVLAAADTAGLGTLIQALPQGLDTPVGLDGAVLSGGQRQRVALARAIYGEPSLVVLDEPNSSLDEEGDAALYRVLQGLKARHATVIVITHRTSLLPITDKILMLRDGAQQAFGPRDEVLAALQKAQQQAHQASGATPTAPAQDTAMLAAKPGV